MWFTIIVLAVHISDMPKLLRWLMWRNPWFRTPKLLEAEDSDWCGPLHCIQPACGGKTDVCWLVAHSWRKTQRKEHIPPRFQIFHADHIKLWHRQAVPAWTGWAPSDGCKIQQWSFLDGQKNPHPKVSWSECSRLMWSQSDLVSCPCPVARSTKPIALMLWHGPQPWQEFWPVCPVLSCRQMLDTFNERWSPHQFRKCSVMGPETADLQMPGSPKAIFGWTLGTHVFDTRERNAEAYGPVLPGVARPGGAGIEFVGCQFKHVEPIFAPPKLSEDACSWLSYTCF